MEGSRRFFSRAEINHLIDMSSLLKDRRPFGIQTLRAARVKSGRIRAWTGVHLSSRPRKTRMPRERRRYVASPTRQRSVSSNDPQTLFLIDSQQPSHLGTLPTSPRRKRSPRSRSGWSRTSRRNTSRIARASSTSPRCAPRSHRSPAQLCAPHRRLQIDPPPVHVRERTLRRLQSNHTRATH